MEKEKIDVRLQQIQMAQNMGIPREGLDFLAALEEREWKKKGTILYLSARWDSC